MRRYHVMLGGGCGSPGSGSAGHDDHLPGRRRGRFACRAGRYPRQHVAVDLRRTHHQRPSLFRLPGRRFGPGCQGAERASDPSDAGGTCRRALQGICGARRGAGQLPCVCCGKHAGMCGCRHRKPVESPAARLRQIHTSRSRQPADDSRTARYHRGSGGWHRGDSLPAFHMREGEV